MTLGRPPRSGESPLADECRRLLLEGKRARHIRRVLGVGWSMITRLRREIWG